AAAFFQAELRGPGGGRARAYLRERGLSEEVIERFGLGWAPGAGEVRARHLRAKSVPLEDALTAGLVMRRDRPDGAGGLLDRFRERIMFPITDTSGKVIAFGGRILPGRPASGEPPPKYLNSAESPDFRKGLTLYGLARARDAIGKADRAIVVEGYLALIALAQAGSGEVVSPLGTALTAEQLRLLRRFTETVIACFDGDLAGRRAAARSFPVFLEAGLWGRGAFLPAGEDPDTFVRAQGRAALERLLAAEATLVELMAEDATVAERVVACGVIAEFQHPEWRRAAEALAQRDETEREARLEALPRDIRERVVRRLLEERPDVERERALADCIARIRRRGARGEERRVRDEIRAAQARGDSEAVEAAMRRLKQLMDETQAEKLAHRSPP